LLGPVACPSLCNVRQCDTVVPFHMIVVFTHELERLRYVWQGDDSGPSTLLNVRVMVLIISTYQAMLADQFLNTEISFGSHKTNRMCFRWYGCASQGYTHCLDCP
jgi:hypothetical protein